MSSMTQQRMCWLNLKWNNNNKYTQRFCNPKMSSTKLYGITQKHHGFRILPFMQERSRIVHIFKCNPTQSLWIVLFMLYFWVIGCSKNFHQPIVIISYPITREIIVSFMISRKSRIKMSYQIQNKTVIVLRYLLPKGFQNLKGNLFFNPTQEMVVKKICISIKTFFRLTHQIWEEDYAIQYHEYMHIIISKFYEQYLILRGNSIFFSECKYNSYATLYIEWKNIRNLHLIKLSHSKIF